MKLIMHSPNKYFLGIYLVKLYWQQEKIIAPLVEVA
jgi:hypothetical protein